MFANLLPTHPITGMRALGWSSRGPIWPVAGGDGTGDGSGGEGGQSGTGIGGGGTGAQSTYTPPATQADLDRIVTDRLARDRARFADYDELKSKAEKFDQHQAASQSEQEKLQAKTAELEKLATTATERANRIARESAIVLEAVKAGAKHPQDIAALLPGDSVTVDKDGNVTGAQSAVEKFKAERAEYFGSGDARRPGPPAHGLGPRAPGEPAPGSLGKAEAERRFGAKK